jgi:hypothetical protein
MFGLDLRIAGDPCSNLESILETERRDGILANAFVISLWSSKVIFETEGTEGEMIDRKDRFDVLAGR